MQPCPERAITLGAIRAASAALVVALVIGGGRSAEAGHTFGHYPSFYPDEIRIDSMDPAAAANGLTDGTLHAYLGSRPAFADGAKGHVRPHDSLGSLLVLSFDPASRQFADAGARCRAARGVLAAVRDDKMPGFVFHPYPVTPYHADYLHHLDRVAAAIAAVAGATDTPNLKIDAKGAVAAKLAGRFKATGGSADAELEEVPVDALMTDAGIQVDGWLGPPWVKEGWFQAYRLLAPGLAAPERRAADDVYRRLLRGDVADLAEQANLERRLVRILDAGCRHVVVGYTLRREYVNDDFSAGVENVAVDSLTGLNSPMFIRTVKLKDYPWNGHVRLGIAGRAEAAWNPVAGFSDPVGRLIWAALGDPAAVMYPFNASWSPNRVQFAVTRAKGGQSGGLKLPAGALSLEAGSGRFLPVVGPRYGSTKVVYDAIVSPFTDGTETGVADLIYPFSFVYRWGAKNGAGDASYDPRLAAALAPLRDRLVGLKALRVESTVKNIAEGFDIIQKIPVLEVYLNDAPGDDHQVAALAPTWSTVPWHLLVLMEEAVMRGDAAFSREEAARRGVPWLDLVRDGKLRDKLKALVAAFAQQGFRPEALKNVVSVEEARGRWKALKAFADKNGHYLVTNGPYRLKSWAPDSVVLQAVREAAYPLGFGTYDRFVEPPQAVIEDVTRQSNAIVVRVDADMTNRVERHYEIKREPLTRHTAHGLFPVLVVSRYLLVGPGGDVISAGKMTWRPDNRFEVRLPDKLPAGRYAVLVGVFLDGNTLMPSTKAFTFSVPGTE